MEKRLLLAVVLMTAAIMFTNVLFPPPEQPAEPEETPALVSPATPTGASALPVAPTGGLPSAATGESVVVESELVRYTFTTRGAALLNAELLSYPSYAVPSGSVQLVPEGVVDFLSYRLVVDGDTVDLRAVPFQASSSRIAVSGDAPGGAEDLEFRYASETGFGITLRYVFEPRGYLTAVNGRIDGLGGRSATLITGLGPGLEVHEHPDHHSEREFAVVMRNGGSIERTPFRRVEGRRAMESPLVWVGIKDKYFLAAVVGGDATPLAGAVVTDAPDVSRTVEGNDLVLPRVEVAPVVPVAADGTFRFDFYLGPQEYQRLAQIGYDLEEVTPYGYRWLQPIIRPLAAAVLWVLNTLHDTLGIAYGWVLVIFGVMMRIVLWPLNAKAMRAQMKNMAVQPLVQEIREKYGNDPEKQKEAMVSLYKDHGFNPFAGCLPLLVPFPVLITLFFVFQNTIAFRGASFLWLPDLSLRDPLYILPVVLVASAFGVQWVMAKMSGIEQNPQMKMMMYVFPVMMGVIFFMLPAGLNLYYSVTQLASIPQQVLIAKERKRATEEAKKSAPPKLEVGTGARKGSRKKR